MSKSSSNIFIFISLAAAGAYLWLNRQRLFSADSTLMPSGGLGLPEGATDPATTWYSTATMPSGTGALDTTYNLDANDTFDEPSPNQNPMSSASNTQATSPLPGATNVSALGSTEYIANDVMVLGGVLATDVVAGVGGRAAAKYVAKGIDAVEPLGGARKATVTSSLFDVNPTKQGSVNAVTALAEQYPTTAKVVRGAVNVLPGVDMLLQPLINRYVLSKYELPEDRLSLKQEFGVALAGETAQFGVGAAGAVAGSVFPLVGTAAGGIAGTIAGVSADIAASELARKQFVAANQAKIQEKGKASPSTGQMSYAGTPIVEIKQGGAPKILQTLIGGGGGGSVTSRTDAALGSTSRGLLTTTKSTTSTSKPSILTPVGTTVSGGTMYAYIPPAKNTSNTSNSTADSNKSTSKPTTASELRNNLYKAFGVK